MSTFPIGAKVGADTSSFVGAMGQATKGLVAFTGAAGLAGVGLGVFVGLMAGASVAAAREYQVELVKLNTLVGIQVEQIESWDDSMRELAVQTGKAPADLAKAMFAISSGGARGQEALELLESTAKASAQGLGDMTSIGRTATAMLQAFGDQGLTAQKAIDVMVATVREGNLEASGLATAFSRVLGPAKSLGSSVEEIGGFLATFTRLGGSTEEAATGLLNVFNLLIKTPKDAREAMMDFGFSIEEVRATLAEDGLPAALALMAEQIGGNIDALGEMIPNTRALIGFLNTAGLQGKEFAAITDRITNSLGLNQEGFETWGESADAAFTQFSAQMAVLKIVIGEQLLPPLTRLLEKMTEWVGKLDDVIDVLDDRFGDPVDAAAESVNRFTDAMTRMDTTALERQLASLPISIREATSELGTLRQELLVLEAATPFAFRTEEEVRAIFALEDEIEKLVELRDLEAVKLGLVEEALSGVTVAREKESDAQERGTALTEEEIKAKEKREKAIADIVLRLDEELFALQRGEAALLDQQLEELNASDATREHVATVLASIKAETDLADLREKNARAAERRLLTLKQKREREEAARVRALERVELARLNDEMREATQVAQGMADSIVSAFEDIISGTERVGDAFGNMVTDILNQINRLLIQRAIVEPLVAALLGSVRPPAITAGVSASSAIPELDFPVIIPGGGGTTSVGASARSVAAPAVVVQQTVNFNTNMIDQRSGQQFIDQHGDRIARIVGEAARNSSGFAAQLK